MTKKTKGMKSEDEMVDKIVEDTFKEIGNVERTSELVDLRKPLRDMNYKEFMVCGVSQRDTK